MVVVYEALEIYFFSYDYKTHRPNPFDFLEASDGILSVKNLLKHFIMVITSFLCFKLN